MTKVFEPCVYILSSQRLGRIYTGSTSNLMQRIFQHRNETFAGHSKRYSIKKLVWFERHEDMAEAILREKRIKKWSRKDRIRLIESGNPEWRDLAVDLGFDPLPFQSVVVRK